MVTVAGAAKTALFVGFVMKTVGGGGAAAATLMVPPKP